MAWNEPGGSGGKFVAANTSPYSALQNTRPAAPEVEMALLDVKQGPVLRVGALGGRHGAVPKLAHVAVGWRF